MDEETRVKLEATLEALKALLKQEDPAKLSEYVEEQHPVDLAETYRLLEDDEKKALMHLLPKELAADIVEELDTEEQTELVDELGSAKASGIIGAMESDDATDLLSELDEEKAEHILSKMGQEEAEEFKELLGYEEDTSGGIMGTEYVALTPGMKVDYALDYIRRTGREAQTLNDIYVVDPDERLVGVLTLRDIVVANPLLTIGEIMHRQVVKVNVNHDQEEVARLFKKYGFSALPVVDDDDVLTGIITADDILDIVEEEATEDIQRMAGVIATEETYLSTRTLTLWGARVIWLIILFFADLSSGFIMKGFEEVLESAVALSFFIPLLIGCAGNAGSQSSAIMIRSLALKEVHLKDSAKVLLKETRIGFLLGLATAAAGIVLSFLIPHTGVNWLQMGLTIGISMMLTVMVGSVVGALLPMIASLLSLDPAVIAGPLITTVVDAVGLLIYFSVAGVIIKV